MNKHIPKNNLTKFLLRYLYNLMPRRQLTVHIAKFKRVTSRKFYFNAPTYIHQTKVDEYCF